MKKKKFVAENFTYESVNRIVLDSIIKCTSFVDDDCFCECILGMYIGRFVIYREYDSANSHYIYRETFATRSDYKEVFNSYVANCRALLECGYTKNTESCV